MNIQNQVRAAADNSPHPQLQLRYPYPNHPIVYLIFNLTQLDLMNPFPNSS